MRETVGIVKTPYDRFALRASGQRQPLAELWSEERRVWRERHGAANYELVERLEKAPPGHAVRLVVSFRPDTPEWSLELPSGSAEEQRGADLERVASIERAGVALIDRFAAEGFTLESFDPAVPWFIGSAHPAAVEALAKLDGVEDMGDATPSRMVRHQTPNSMTEPQIDVTLNAAGLYGAGEKVGLLENPCYIWTGHDTFAPPDSSSVTFKDTASQGCNPGISGDCNDNCDVNANAQAACLPIPQAGGQLRCVDRHMNWTASAIKVKRSGGKWGAADALRKSPHREHRSRPIVNSRFGAS